ncbi:type II toxin-antitoxin system VapC family toxin [Candidatus Bathyarchaeota archaeon]|nr:type II toxin-antitoxin system VapC family toxin [Candidatus Bathyarchaeota archaeon]
MSVRSVYLDTSALVKRYVVEEHSDRVDELYSESYAGRVRIGFSVWNIGEVAVVLDKYEERGIVEDARIVFARFIGESHLLVKLNQLKLIPLNFRVVVEAVNYVFKHGIYVADAVQLASAEGFDTFLTYDEKLAQIAKIEGLNVI